jgi:hypothetical protein
VTSHQEAVVDLLRRMGDLSPGDATIRIVDCGLHSGLPVCCVRFFVEAWWPANVVVRWSSRASSVARKQARATIDSYRGVFGSLDVGYVPCPRCARSRSFVAARPCGPHLSKRQRDHVRRMLES